MRHAAAFGGSLFPRSYLGALDGGPHPPVEGVARAMSGFDAWWRQVEATSGSASGIRHLFDVVAMPLFGRLGFRASRAQFSRECCRAVLETPGHDALALLLLPWAARPPSRWRDAADAARAIASRWCFVLAPPFLSLLDVRGFGSQRRLDIALPQLRTRGIRVFVTLLHARGFDVDRRTGTSRFDQFLLEGARHEAAVGDDLRRGVLTSLHDLTTVLRGVPMTRGPRTARPEPPASEPLTLIYRILFLLFAESRGLVAHSGAIWESSYAMSAMCREALAPHPRFSLWDGLAAASRLWRDGWIGADLTAHAFNGHLFARASAPSLETRRKVPKRVAGLREASIRRALVALGSRADAAGRQPISYRDLGVEQLGGVYEHLLDAPVSSASPPRASARARGQNDRRKQTGTFYTPRPLAEFVVRRTLAPLVAGAAPDEILSLRVVDPAMGSGAFLVAACRFLAAAYIDALIEHGYAGAEDFGDADRANIRRLIAEKCLAGVDRNPVAVELARLSLWLTTIACGKPLSFLDHRLRVGDSLVGAAPADLLRAATPRRGPRSRDLPLFEEGDLAASIQQVAGAFEGLLTRHDDTLRDVRAKETTWRGLTSTSSALYRWKVALSLWCARWFWPRAETPAPDAAELRALLDSVLRGDATLPASHVTRRIDCALRSAGEHGFFHWPLEFPDVFYEADGRPRPRSGFDAAIGNPPWEMLRQADGASEADESGSRHPEANARFTRFVRESGIYVCSGQGHLNLYQPFLERSLALVRPGGRAGLILPWGFASDDGAAELRHALASRGRLDTVVGLDNASGLFPIHRGMRFVAVVTSPESTRGAARARFGVRSADEIDALPASEDGSAASAFPIRLTAASLFRVGGPAIRIPDIRDPKDLDLLEQLNVEFPRLGSAASWHAEFGRELNATEARRWFGTSGMPVLEGKQVTAFRVAATSSAIRIDRATALRLLPAAPFDRPRLAYRDVSAVGNMRALIAAVLPAGVVTTHTLLCLKTPVAEEQQYYLCGLFNSHVLNRVVRLLMGGHLTTTLVEGLPVPRWSGDARDRRLARLARQAADGDATTDTLARLQACACHAFRLSAQWLSHVLDATPALSGADARAIQDWFERERVQ